MRRRAACIVLGLLLSLLVALASAGAVTRPNVVLIIGDDLGWTDLGFMGSSDVATPALDALAESGTVFTHAFAPVSICRPSLRSLLTGVSPQAVAARIKAARKARAPRPVRLRDVFDTLPGLLGARGYVSFQGGKHWEGSYADAGFTHGMTEAPGPGKEPGPEPWYRDRLFAYAGARGLVLGRDTMQPLWDFLDEARERPFFVWYAPLLPHAPFDAPPRFRAPYSEDGAKGASEDAIGYRANVSRFDATVGELLARLDALGLRRDTVVLYLNDNGWDADAGLAQGARGKGSLSELGVRTPLVVSWPGVVPKGVRDDRLVALVDVLPTVAEIVGAPPPRAIEGRSVFGAALGTDATRRAHLVGGAGADARFVRTPSWRYVRSGPAVESLYRIDLDPHERADLAAKHPDVLESLRSVAERYGRE